MGAVLKKLKWRRGSYLVSTKFFWGLHDNPNEKNTLNRKYLIEAMNGSLRRLDMEYVDIIFCHRPDPNTPIEETVWAMHNLIEWGKALYWGTSEWEAADIVSAIDIAEKHHLHKPIVEQPVYNLFEQHRLGPEYDAVYKKRGYGSTIWSPLASGILTASTGVASPMAVAEPLKATSGCKRGCSMSAVSRSLIGSNRSRAIWARRWPSSRWPGACRTGGQHGPDGASRVERIHENMKALNFAKKFSDDVMAEIDAILAEGLPRYT